MAFIYTSKLYLASKRKDKIQAAAQSPLNLELVKQLRSYLDEEYQTPSYVDTGDATSEEADKDTSQQEEQIRPSEHHSSSNPHPSGGGPSPGGELDFGETSSPVAPPSDTGAPADEEVQEAIDINSEEITESSSCEEIASELESLLNDSEETSGIIRTRCKNDEIWLYFNDNVNLNRVMESVIDIATAKYNDIEFNRLARMDNAIVFVKVD